MASSSDLTREQNLRMAEKLVSEPDRPSLQATKAEKVKEILVRTRGKGRLADVGCFDGSLTAAYLGLGFTSVDGFDVSEPALERARQRGVDTFLWNFETDRAPVADDTYDALVCTDVVEHVYNTQNLVRECRRVLKPDGTAVFVVPNLASLKNRLLLAEGRMPSGSPGVSVSVKTEGQVNLGHARAGTALEWKGLLLEEGFSVRQVQGIWGSRLGRTVCLSRASLAHSILFECGKGMSKGVAATAHHL